MELRVGKVPWETLAGMIGPFGDLSVLQGPGLGLDAAALDLGGRVLVTATDPVTFATSRVGWYSVWVNANDVAACGARPRWFQAVVLLPEKDALGLAAETTGQIRNALEDLGAVLVGGHTEVTAGLDRPVVVGQMMGEAAGGKVLSAAGAAAGDSVLFAGHVALEATGLLASELSDRLARGGLSQDELAEARGLLDKPGIGIVSAALAALHTGKVTAMHDVTEGGLAQACRELAGASHAGLELHANALPMYDVTRRICDLLGVDPLGAIGSGGLLITCPADHAFEVSWAVRLNGTRCEVIGRVTETGEVLLTSPDGDRPMPRFDRDEVARVLSEGA